MFKLKFQGVRRRTGAGGGGEDAETAMGAAAAAAPAGPSLSVGAEEMTWADAGSGVSLAAEQSQAQSGAGAAAGPPPPPPQQPKQQPRPKRSLLRSLARRRQPSPPLVPLIRVVPPDTDTDTEPDGEPRPGPSRRRTAMDSPDLQLTPDASQDGGDLSDSSFTDVEGGGEDEDEDEETQGLSDAEAGAVKIPLRSARRMSVRPPAIRLNDDDIECLDVPEHSPGNSITSINSIASLLKEKIALTLPAAVKKKPMKRSSEFKLRLFVGFLFLCIVSLVGFAYVFYHQQVLQRAYFERMRFNNKERVVRVLSDRDAELVYGLLGSGLGQDPSFRCLQRHEVEGAACMEWMHKARLYMRSHEQQGSRCYAITWESLSDGVAPTDCYDWSSGHGHWYGGGQTPGMEWPVEKGRVRMAPFVTGDTRTHQWGNVLKRYFVNSKGVVIFVDPDTPLYVSLNDEEKHQFCLQARYDNFTYVYHRRPRPTLNYTICTSSNMSSLHAFRVAQHPPGNLTEDDRELVEKLMTEPIWHVSAADGADLTERLIYNYTVDVLELKYFKLGHVLINEFWQTNVGDLLLDPDRFPTMKSTIDIIQRRGFRVIFSVQPFISTESVNFREAVREGLLVRQRGPAQHIPALTSYKSVLSAGVLDVTNPRAVPWLQAKLKTLADSYLVDAFYVDAGTAYDMPHYYMFQRTLANPDEYKTVFADSVAGSVRVVGVSSAISRPRGPVFVSLPPFPCSWAALQSVIATVLTYGIIGFPLVLPGPVGGDSPVNSSGPLPDKELYMRWMQLAAFLPAVSFSHLPNAYGDRRVEQLAEELSGLRQREVNPIVKEYLKPTGPLDQGFPFNQPLWMLDPLDPICHMVVDEFSVGDSLIVAPIITAGAREREVYLPAGFWLDGIDGSLRKGSRWLHHYKVEENKIAFFTRTTP